MTSKYDEITALHDYGILPSTRELFLGANESEYVDQKLAMTFIKNLSYLEKAGNKPVIIHQYSYGGSTSAGMAIYDAIQNSKCSFVFLSYGCCASMGSIIPQAVLNKGYRLTMPNCEWLIHEGSINLESTYKAAISNMESIIRGSEKHYNIYVKSCMNAPFFEGYSPSKIKAYLKRKLSSKEDWWICGEEVVNYGFADAIFGTKDYENIQTVLGYI